MVKNVSHGHLTNKLIFLSRKKLQHYESVDSILSVNEKHNKYANAYLPFFFQAVLGCHLSRSCWVVYYVHLFFQLFVCGVYLIDKYYKLFSRSLLLPHHNIMLRFMQLADLVEGDIWSKIFCHHLTLFTDFVYMKIE